MVHRVELVVVELIDILDRICHTRLDLLKLVDTDERNLHTSRSITEGLGTGCRTEGVRTDEVEDTWAIELHEQLVPIGILLAVLVVDVVEEILDECGIYMMDGMTYLDIPVADLSGDAVLVFLNLIQREEMEEGGVILSLLEDRVILKWLERLEELDRMEA